MNTVTDVDRLYNAIEINEKTFQFFRVIGQNELVLIAMSLVKY